MESFVTIVDNLQCLVSVNIAGVAGDHINIAGDDINIVGDDINIAGDDINIADDILLVTT